MQEIGSYVLSILYQNQTNKKFPAPTAGNRTREFASRNPSVII